MNLLKSLLDWIFPQESSTKTLENLTPYHVHHQATKNTDQFSSFITSLYTYKDPLVSKAIWELKYRGNRNIANLLGALLYQAIHEKVSDEILFSNMKIPLLIPLPLSKERLHERGWSQTEMLAKSIIDHDTNHILQYKDKILIKIRHTSPQTTLSKKDRRKNLEGCFAINPLYKNLIKNRDVILIDDVATTGSTIIEAEKTLKAAGVRSIYAFTVAH